MNKFDMMREAVSEAKETIRAADSVVNSMAQMIVGRLKKVDIYTLGMLKKELKGFNSNTGQWKDGE